MNVNKWIAGMAFIFGILLIAVGASSCGSSGSGGAGTPAGSTPVNSSSVNTYTLTLSGDNVQFTLSMIADQGTADEEQQNVAPTLVPVGSSISFSVTGNTLTNVGVTRTAGGAANVPVGPWLNMTLYKNGVPMESASLSDSGTFHTFGDL